MQYLCRWTLVCSTLLMSIAPSILLVDDDHDLCEMVCMALKAQQWTVSCVSGGSGVLPFLETSKPDLILMDIYLGDADGRTICKNIKETEGIQQIPILLYSAGIISHTSIQDSLANRFISKPFDLILLIQTIKSLLHKG